jgi:F0F1-type ATP synthase membrane subunit b/b'
MTDPKHIVDLNDQVEQTRTEAQTLISETDALVAEAKQAIEPTQVVIERTRAASQSDASTARTIDAADSGAVQNGH